MGIINCVRNIPNLLYIVVYWRKIHCHIKLEKSMFTFKLFMLSWLCNRLYNIRFVLRFFFYNFFLSNCIKLVTDFNYEFEYLHRSDMFIKCQPKVKNLLIKFKTKPMKNIKPPSYWYFYIIECLHWSVRHVSAKSSEFGN